MRKELYRINITMTNESKDGSAIETLYECSDNVVAMREEFTEYEEVEQIFLMDVVEVVETYLRNLVVLEERLKGESNA